jgi:hypothetical protein
MEVWVVFEKGEDSVATLGSLPLPVSASAVPKYSNTNYITSVAGVSHKEGNCSWGKVRQEKGKVLHFTQVMFTAKKPP